MCIQDLTGSIRSQVKSYQTMNFQSILRLFPKWIIDIAVFFTVFSLASIIAYNQNLFYEFFSSVTQSCPTLCDPMNSSMPGLPIHHQLPESTQTHVHLVDDAIQPSHYLPSPYPSVLSLSQHQGLFQRVSSSNQVAKVLELQLQHQSVQWTPRSDLP